jgi:hypothetical protein
MPKVAQKTAPSSQPFTTELRSAIADSGRPPSALAAEAGISHTIVIRFLARMQSLSLDSADALAEVLGLRVIRARKAKPKKV